MARLGASGDQWAVPRAQSRRTEPYWDPGEVDEEGVLPSGGVVALLVRCKVKQQQTKAIMDDGNPTSKGGLGKDSPVSSLGSSVGASIGEPDCYHLH